MNEHQSHLQPDGSTFPPVTPDPPPPPGYVDPLEALESDVEESAPAEADEGTRGGDGAGSA